MKQIILSLGDQLTKMTQNNSWNIGVISGITLAIPYWVLSDTWTLPHSILILILLGVLVLDWITGNRLATKSTVMKKNTTTVIDSLIRDGLIFFICGLSYGVDFLLGTHSILFTVFTVAFIYHNFTSFVANATVLGWDKYYPLWLFQLILRWVGDEIQTKQDKYFKKIDKS